MSVLRLARRYTAEALRGFERTPAEFAAALGVALAFSFALEQDAPAMDAWAEIAATALLIAITAWCGSYLHALGLIAARTRWLITLVGAVIWAAFGAWLLHVGREAEVWRAWMLIIAGVLVVLTLPVFARREEDPVTRMRVMDGRFLLRTLGAGLYGAALFAGLAIALAAINSLFELKLDEEIFGHTAAWIFFVLVPWVVFSGIDEYVRPAGAPSGAAQVVHRIIVLLAVPLLLLYFAILYAYAVRIGLTGELPKNLVSPMVLAAGALGLATLLLFDPRPQTSGVARTLRLIPALFVPLAPLGAWALMVRIEQYGWTEFRVLRLVAVAALAALAVAAAIQVMRRRPLALHVVPPALALTLVLISLGPWSALAISRRSQQARLEVALERAAVTPQTLADTTSRIIDAQLYQQLEGSAQFLLAHFGPEALPRMIAERVRSSDRWLDMIAVLRVMPAADTVGPERPHGFAALAHGVAVQTSLGELYRVEYPFMSGPNQRPPVPIVQDSLVLRLVVAQRTLSADITPLLALRGNARRRPQPTVDPALLTLPLRDANGVQQGELILMDVAMNFDSAQAKVARFSGVVILSGARQ